MIREKAFLVGIQLADASIEDTESSLEELCQLAETSGCDVCGSRIFKRSDVNAATYIGEGQLEAVKNFADELSVETVIFDINSLRPLQYNNLEDFLARKVLSRCDVILDIFAQRASSSEARIQVELAQLTNMLPRIRGKGVQLSRLGGGIGTRGPGETKLETDRRHITHRIQKLKDKLGDVQHFRDTKRKGRRDIFTISVAGYTNAGKSSLLKLLAKKEVVVENRLFATLDSLTRSVYLGDGVSALFTDTVGFIRNLPAALVKAFRSTFEEIKYSDFVVIVADVSVHDWREKLDVVALELAEIGIDKSVIFFNKVDAAPPSNILEAAASFPDSIMGSVKDKTGIDELKTFLLGCIPENRKRRIF